MATEALAVSSSKKRRNRRGRRQKIEIKTSMIRMAPERPLTPSTIPITNGPPLLNSHEMQLR